MHASTWCYVVQSCLCHRLAVVTRSHTSWPLHADAQPRRFRRLHTAVSVAATGSRQHTGNTSRSQQNCRDDANRWRHGHRGWGVWRLSGVFAEGSRRGCRRKRGCFRWRFEWRHVDVNAHACCDCDIYPMSHSDKRLCVFIFRPNGIHSCLLREIRSRVHCLFVQAPHLITLCWTVVSTVTVYNCNCDLRVWHCTTNWIKHFMLGLTFLMY